MSRAARSPNHCPFGSFARAPMPAGASGCPLPTIVSSRSSATPMVPATVACDPSGDSGTAVARMASARSAWSSGLHEQAQGRQRERTWLADRREELHVPPLDRPVEGTLQRLHVVDRVRVVEVDAVLGKERSQLTHQVVGHAGLMPDLWTAPRRLGRRTTDDHTSILSAPTPARRPDAVVARRVKDSADS